MHKNKKYQGALRLRKKGYSYGEIKKITGIAKSTCSQWFKNLSLSEQANNRLKIKEFRGRVKSIETIKQKIGQRNDLIKSTVLHSLNKIRLTQDSIKLLCSLLYWAEGEKTGNKISFTNSDPLMIRLFVNLFQKSFPVKRAGLKAVLHLHSYHDPKKQVAFWSQISGIPSNRIIIYNKANSGKNIRPGYPGCISIRYYDVKVYKELEFFYTLFAQNIGTGV